MKSIRLFEAVSVACRARRAPPARACRRYDIVTVTIKLYRVAGACAYESMSISVCQ